MHYEVRGLIEENIDYFIDHSAHSVVWNEHLNDLEQDTLTKIAAECMCNRIMGFHQMWCFIGDNTPEDGHGEDILQVVRENYEHLAYAVDQHIMEYDKQNSQQQQEKRPDKFDPDLD